MNIQRYQSIYPKHDIFYFYKLYSILLLSLLFTVDFERNYDPEAASYFMKNNNWLPIVSVILYALFIHFGPKYMEKREPFNLRVSKAFLDIIFFIITGSLLLIRFPLAISYFLELGTLLIFILWCNARSTMVIACYAT